MTSCKWVPITQPPRISDALTRGARTGIANTILACIWCTANVILRGVYGMLSGMWPSPMLGRDVLRDSDSWDCTAVTSAPKRRKGKIILNDIGKYHAHCLSWFRALILGVLGPWQVPLNAVSCALQNIVSGVKAAPV
jgi:hypothetical protein